MSHAGNRRVEPSRNMTYQSGCDAAETCAGLYGPHSHTGLICTRPPSAAQTPNTMKNRPPALPRSEEHTSELQSRQYLVCRLLLEKKNIQIRTILILQDVM